MKHLPTLGLLLTLALTLVSCRGDAQAVTGRILFWHDLPADRAAALEESIDRFQQVYPDTEVIVNTVEPGTLNRRYTDAARQGFGPDMVLAPSPWILNLASENLIRPINAETAEIGRFITPAQATLNYNNALYGLPLYIETQALYYNTSLVTQPAATLDELLQQAAAGQGAAINTRFVESFWGIGAFGGQLFDADGRLLLDGGGYASWLNWLRQAQDTPGIVLGTDAAALRDLFVRGQVAYYVDSPAALKTLTDALGTDRVGVSPLPAGPAGPATPLLYTYALLFSSASSDSQAGLALQLARFITNAEQSAALMRRLEIVPANRQVRVDPRAYPRVYGFNIQTRTAVPRVNTPQMQTVLDSADTIVTQVLAGSRDAIEGMQTFTRSINDTFGFTETQTAEVARPNCPASGTLSIWHSWTQDAETVLKNIIAAYEAVCPGIEVNPVHFSRRDLLDTYRTMSNVGLGPDILLTWAEDLTTLGPDNLVQPLNDGDSIIQRYLPATIDALRYNNQVFGLPISLSTLALYYNTERITDPPNTLDSLMREAEGGSGLALATTFVDGWWGASAYGAQLFDEQYNVILADTGFVDWLTLLTRLQVDSDIYLTSDTASARGHFLSGDAAYYVGPPAHLPTLIDEMGASVVGVARLPVGTAGPSSPWLHVQALLFNRSLDTEQLALARSFAIFATSAESQKRLHQRTALVPANITAELPENDLRRVFLTQARDAFVAPHVPQINAVLAAGDSVYRAVLQDAVPPADAAADFQAAVNATIEADSTTAAP